MVVDPVGDQMTVAGDQVGRRTAGTVTIEEGGVATTVIGVIMIATGVTTTGTGAIDVIMTVIETEAADTMERLNIETDVTDDGIAAAVPRGAAPAGAKKGGAPVHIKRGVAPVHIANVNRAKAKAEAVAAPR